MIDILIKLSPSLLSSIIIALLLITITLILIVVIQLVLNSNNRDKMSNINARNERNTKEIIRLNQDRLSLISKNSDHVNYLSSVYQTIQQGILVFSSDCEIVLINPFAKKILGLSNGIFFQDEIDGRLDKINEMIQNVKETNEDYEIIITEDKKLYLKYVVSKIADKYKSNVDLGYLVSIHDISETEVNNKLRNEFIENISHEFKTPMTIILGYVETLKLWDDLDLETRDRSLEVIELEVSRLNLLVDKLLNLTKVKGIEKTDSSEIDIVNLSKNLINHFESIANDYKVNFSLQYEKVEILVKAETFLIVNALSNIIENAIKYTDTNDTVLVNIFETDEYCNISIKDNGQGIEKKHLDRIFERFYRVDKDRNSETGGTGLGLAISKDSVERLGGQIEVSSTIGKGTEFLIKLVR